MSNLTDFIGGSLKWWDEIYTTNPVDTGNGVIQNPAEFTTSGTFTVPAGVTEVMVGICGGGGGGLYGTVDGVAGGGGSAMTYHKVSVTPGETIPITIGAGGVEASNVAGSGGDSSFGTYVIVKGGGGAGGGSTLNPGIGANGGGNGGGGGRATGEGSTNGHDITCTKVINGVPITKTISGGSGGYRYGGGGAGGGFDYEGVGGNINYNGDPTKSATGYGAGGGSSNIAGFANGTAGICVIWY